MTSTSISTRRGPVIVRHTVAGALAVAMLAGCAGTIPIAKVIGYASSAEAASPRKIDKAVAKAENAVAKRPSDISARTALGQAYLAAGRFDSAATALNDAMTLGDSSPRTALSLALAHIGGGRNQEAISLLDHWRDSIPASDLGLALALAGETGRGVALLSDALRGGEASAKLRQNLAYAYALDGRWREARVMASQDVAPDQLDARISAWALTAKPEDFQRRVAGLLGVPVRPDSGMPQRLALAGTQNFAAAAPAEAPQAAPAGELAALDGTPGEAAPAAVSEPAFAAAPEPQTVSVASADPAPAAAAAPQTRFVSEPVVQTAPAARPGAWKSSHAPVVQRVQAVFTKASTANAPASSARIAAADCSHFVQLGSFASEDGARRALKVLASRHPNLRGRDMTITPAVVNGKKFWRVATGTQDKRSAANICSSVKGQGGACFAYAASRPVPGALPAGGVAGPMRARR